MKDTPKTRDLKGQEETPSAPLVESAREGNRNSFERLVDIYRESIYRLIYYRVGSRMEAEDLTQDVFIRAYQGISGLKDADLFKPWLFRIAVNRVRDYHKKKRILVFFGLEGDRPEQEYRKTDRGDEEVSGPDSLIRQEFWGLVRSFMNGLGRWEREVFFLRFFDQLNIREIARVLGRSESTVKTHLYRALGKFRDSPELNLILEGEGS